MIEIAIGSLLLAAALLTGLGFSEGLAPFSVGPGTISFLCALGLLLIFHGLYRVRLKKPAVDRHWMKTLGLMWVMVLILTLLCFGVPFAGPLLNAFKVAGFNLGYYLAAQGVLIAVVAVAFVFASRADAIDDKEIPAEDGR